MATKVDNKMIEELRVEAQDAIDALLVKHPIKKGGKTTGEACVAGRLDRFIDSTKQMDLSDPKFADKINKIADSLESALKDAVDAASAAVTKYTETCKFANVAPSTLSVRNCDCGHCSGTTAGKVDALWTAESAYRKAVFDMLTDVPPVLDNEAVLAVREAYGRFESISATLGREIDHVDLFYSNW